MKDMRTINVAVIGTGWCGGIRAETCARSAFVRDLHIAEIREERLEEVAALTRPVIATRDYRELLEDRSIDAVLISTTPEPTHYPIAKESLEAGKHVLLEKPIALEVSEADELIGLAREKNLLFTIGYSQRFNPKFAYVKRAIDDGSIGEPVSALVSRNITRNLGKKIGGRVKLSPAAMEATHDIDFVLWCLAPRKPVRVYAQEVRKVMGREYNVPDCVWIVVTMDDGIVFTIGAGWVLPPAYPNFSSCWIEVVGTNGAVMADDTHRDVYVTTLQKGIQFPISSMPGESLGHVYAGPMAAETVHFLECVATGRQPVVTPEHARMVMQVYQAADISVETGQPVEITVPESVAAVPC
ncbi:MAG TPA: Gfo/Idh/MocA family oxidoreductase [Bryobacteraceae bacterium]